MLLRAPGLIRPRKTVLNPLLLGRVGVNLGNIGDASEVTDYETWLGKPVHHVELFNGDTDWADVVDSIGFIALSLYGDVPRWRWLTIHPIPDGSPSLSEAATGAYNQYWIACAKVCLQASYPAYLPIPIRAFHEFNLSTQANHYAIGDAASLIAAFRHFVNCFRTVSDRFIFRWCPNREDAGNNLADYYPGDDVVDIISMDTYAYLGGGGFSGDPTGAASYEFSSNNGKVGWIAKFARLHNKPWGLDEWATAEDGWESYVTTGFTTTRDLGASYIAWWESDAAYQGVLSDGGMGTTGTAYQSLFGAGEAWTPAQITPTRWFNAQADLVGVTDGTAIATVNDYSSNNADWTQASGTLQPLAATMVNGKRSIDFDGSDDVLTGSGPVVGTSASTMALVAKPSSGTTGSRHAWAFGNSTNGQNRVISRIGSPVNAFRLSCIGTGNDLDISAVVWNRDGDDPDLVVWECDPAATSLEFSVYINGDPTPYTFNATGTAINTTTSTAYLGGRNGVAENWRGPLCEGVFKVGAALSTDDRQKLEGYMAWNNGIESRLHASHPYKNAPPFV